jgi:DNA-binding response OmpR family regulator
MAAPTARLLFVEDDLALIDIFKLRFEAEGFEVKVATDGAQGLKAMKEYKPDLVLLDIMMPVMSGFEVLQQMRKDTALKDVKVVVLTALGEGEAEMQAMQLGAIDFVVKAHVPLADMVGIVRKNLGLPPGPETASAV